MTAAEGKKILLVEDEVLIAIQQIRELEGYGYRVRHVLNGEEAVEAVLAGETDLVLMDVDLGAGMDGTEAASIILERISIPIVFLSSYTDGETVEKTEKITSYGYVVKESGSVVLDTSIKMAFKLFEAHNNERKHEARLRLLSEALESSANAVLITDREGNIEWTNPAWTELTGYTGEEVLGRNPRILKSGIQNSEYYREMWDEITSGRSWSGELVNRRKDGRFYYEHAKITPLIGEDGEISRFIGEKEDITGRKRAEIIAGLTIQIQKALLQKSSKPEVLRMILEDLQDGLGLEAVGIRLREGEDYPYFVTNGFPADFVEAERSLCARNENGEVVRDAGGNPVLECMCGNVIRGRVDPSLPFFTDQGSFWTNSTNELLASTSEEDRQARTRNRCNGEGYESVALIPLPGIHGNIGLLQLNDRRKDCFFPELMENLEAIAGTISISMERILAEEKLSESEKKMRSIFRVAPTGIGVVRDRIITDVNMRVCEITGYAKEELIGESARILYPSREDYDYVGREKYRQISEKGTGRVETVWRKKDGTVINVLLSSTPIDISDLSKGVTFTALDITEKKQAEDAVMYQLREKETLLKEVHHRVKNNIASIASLLNMQAASLEGSEAGEPLKKALSRVESMGRMYEKLLIREEYSTLNVKEYLEDLIGSIVQIFMDKSSVALHVEIEDFLLNVSDLSAVGIIVNELITNSIKYGFETGGAGELTVSLNREGETAVLSVSDNGKGMPEGFDLRKEGGFGLTLVRMLTEQIGGTCEILSGNGTSSRVRFPVGTRPLSNPIS